MARKKNMCIPGFPTNPCFYPNPIIFIYSIQKPLQYLEQKHVFQSFPNVIGSTVLTGKIVVGPMNYDLFPDQMSGVFRDQFHVFYFLSMHDYKE